MKRYMVAAAVASVLFSVSPVWAQEEADSADPPAEAAEAAPAEAAPEPVSSVQQSPAAGEVMGPGGRPLRTDYPGTPESLQARMKVAGVEGLQVDANEPGAAYGLRIRELETRIDDLKERVFQSKARIVLLRETLLSGNLAGARAVISHGNELGGTWKIEQAYYALDGTKLANRTDQDRDVKDRKSFQVYEGSVSPGSHSLNVLIKYRGTNVGIFPYFKKYNGEVKTSCDFRAEEGKVARIHVSVYPQGGIAQTIEQRPQLKCEVNYFENLREATAPTEDASQADDSQESDSE